MDYRTLRDELQAGSRLPNPTYSTPKISHLIQTCWLADPIERPTFSKLKNNLRESGNNGFDPDFDSRDYRYLTVLPSNAMRNQYKKIQECNPLYKVQETFDIDDKTITIENGSTATSSPCTSYPYLRASTSANTTITDLNTTSTYQNSTLSYSIPSDKKDSPKWNEAVPLLRIGTVNDEEEIIDEVF